VGFRHGESEVCLYVPEITGGVFLRETAILPSHRNVAYPLGSLELGTLLLNWRLSLADVMFQARKRELELAAPNFQIEIGESKLNSPLHETKV